MSDPILDAAKESIEDYEARLAKMPDHELLSGVMAYVEHRKLDVPLLLVWLGVLAFCLGFYAALFSIGWKLYLLLRVAVGG